MIFQSTFEKILNVNFYSEILKYKSAIETLGQSFKSVQQLFVVEPVAANNSTACFMPVAGDHSPAPAQFGAVGPNERNESPTSVMTQLFNDEQHEKSKVVG